MKVLVYQDVIVIKRFFRRKENKHDYNSTIRENMHVSRGGYRGNYYS